MSAIGEATARLAEETAQGQGFFRAACEILSQGLGWRWVFIGNYVCSEAPAPKVLASWDREAAGPVDPEALAAVLDAETHEERVCGAQGFANFIPRIGGPSLADRLADRPADRLGARSLRRRVLAGKDGKAMGWVLALDDGTEPDLTSARMFFQLVTQRIEAELVRWHDEQVIEKSRDLLIALINQAPAAMALSDSTGQVLLKNAEFAGLRDLLPDGAQKDIQKARGNNAGDVDAGKDKTSEDKPKEDKSSSVVISRYGAGQRQVLVTRYPIHLRGGSGHDTADAQGTIVTDITGLDLRSAEKANDGRPAAKTGPATSAEPGAPLPEPLPEPMQRLAHGLALDIKGLLSLLRDNLERMQLQPEDRPHLAEIQRAAERGAALSDTLLALAQNAALEPSRLMLADHLEGLRPDLRRFLGSDIALDMRAQTGLWPCQVDPGALSRALMALAANAAEAMPAGGRLVVRAHNLRLSPANREGDLGLPSGDYLAVSLADTGRGIAEDLMDKVLQPYFTTHRPHQGRGLGLCLADSVARQSGGRLMLYSVVGKGTTVTLYLPSAQAAKPNAGAKSTRPPLDAPVARKQVLLVGDKREMLAVIGEALESLEYAVVTAATAQAALNLLASGAPIDLVLSDSHLPGGQTGADLARSAKALKENLWVVILSGQLTDDLSHTALSHTSCSDNGEPELPRLCWPFDKKTLSSALTGIQETA